MRRAPTLADVAARAGVSYATADRVVNARSKVAEKSMQRVLQAVADLGYVRNVSAANLAQRRTYHFCFIIPAGSNTFLQQICRTLDLARKRGVADHVALHIRRVAAFDPPGLVDCLQTLGDVDGVALVGLGDPAVQDAIAALRARGVAVVALISDMPGAGRDAYIGIDNIVAGQTAGGLIALAHGGRSGRVLPIVGSLSARDHADRLQGLRQTLAASDLTIAPEVEGRDQHGIVATLLQKALAEDPDITAVYSVGAGNAGLIRVINGLGADRPRPIVVLHELVPHVRRALEEGLIDIVIDQRPEDEVAAALAALRTLADRRPVSPAPPIVPAIYLKENLPVPGPAHLSGPITA